MKELETFSIRVEAEMVCSVLNNNKIYCIINALSAVVL